MINKGKQFENDIKLLKKLAALRKKDKKKYQARYINLRNRISENYGVSIRAVQIWIKRRTPWIRDKRDDVGKQRVKLKRETKKMLHDAIDSGLTRKKAKSIVAKKSGEKISDRKLGQILSRETETNDTGFGSEAKEFFRRLFEIDLIPAEKGIKMRYKKQYFIINKSDLEDICRILGNAYNRYSDAKNKMMINRASFRKSKLWQLYDEAVTVINERGVNIADLKEISLFIQRLEIDRNKINPRIITFWKIIQNFKTDVTLDEVISMAEEYEGIYD